MITWSIDILKNDLYLTLSKYLEEFKNKNLHENKYEIEILGLKFVQYTDVFPADKFFDTEFFTNQINVKKNEDFLEVGIGSGITSIIVSEKGANVVGVDINPSAVINAKDNAQRHGIDSRTTFFVSDVFENVQNSKFDTIYWNVPFCCTDNECIDLFQKSVFDYQYKSLDRFISDAKKYLKPEGKLLIGFSNKWGCPDKLIQMLFKNNFRDISIVAQTDVSWNNINFDLTLYEMHNYKN